MSAQGIGCERGCMTLVWLAIVVACALFVIGMVALFVSLR